MTRFSKGATDHDGDGHMGGSRKAAFTGTSPKPAGYPFTWTPDELTTSPAAHLPPLTEGTEPITWDETAAELDLGDNAMAKGSKKRAKAEQDPFKAAAEATSNAQKAKAAADGAKQKVQRMTRADETAEAQPTKAKAQEAAKDQFAEADEAAAGDGELKLRMAALGGF